ncbi:MAG: MauE/DoxX family redox-associated membrane protein [Desulfobacterales bacterium]|nr:MauE/DoxX family redox-associated membrane protein [Desulfobacterales bacterium]
MAPPEPLGRLAWIELLARWVVGLLFVLASLHKILQPAVFAQIVYSYQLFPDFSINLIAIFLPFVELVAGLALIFGIYPRAAAAIVNALLVAFMLIIAFNLMRGHEFDCGCFPTFVTRLFAESPISMLLRNVILLAFSLPLAFYRGRRRGVLFRTAAS